MMGRGVSRAGGGGGFVGLGGDCMAMAETEHWGLYTLHRCVAYVGCVISGHRRCGGLGGRVRGW